MKPNTKTESPKLSDLGDHKFVGEGGPFSYILPMMRGNSTPVFCCFRICCLVKPGGWFLFRTFNQAGASG